jgi:histidinol-phosphate aminotransferase
VRAALAAAGGVLAAGSRAEALEFAASVAPEHLLLAMREPADALANARNAGTVFLGADHSVAFGDYLTGANHVLPTAGFARLDSGLSTSDFVRWTTWQRLGPGAAARLADDVAILATAEGLPGHAAAARAAAAAATLAADEAPIGRARVASDGESDTGAAAGEAGAAREPREPEAEIVALDDNTNLFGIPPAAAAALAGSVGNAPRYPEAHADALRSALADYAGASPEEIVTGCGSDDVLDLAFRALAEPGDLVAWPAPTFSMVAEFARHNRLRARAVTALAGGAPDPDALLEGDPAIVYLCSPNNPTGAALPARVVEAVLARSRGVVILDQAYAEFAAGGLARPAPRHPRLLVARTLSKAFGLAGLRVGYGVAPREIAARLADVRGPYRVAGPSERAAVAALTRDRDWVAARASETVAFRERLAARLRSLGFTPLPSCANFLLVPVAAPVELAARLAAHGVRVRAFPALERVGGAIRIGVGPWPLMERLLAAWSEETR